MPDAPGKATRRSLTDYVMLKKREGCKVCALGAPIIVQMKEARGKKINRGIVVEWLNDEFAVIITRSDLDSHYNGRHDDA